MPAIPSNNVSLLTHFYGYLQSSNGHELIDIDIDLTNGFNLSNLRGVLFTDGTIISLIGPITFNDYIGKTFAQKFNTEDFNAYSSNSANSTQLIGTTDSSNNQNKAVQLIQNHNSTTYPYATMLLSPHNYTDPTLIVDRTNPNVVDEATLWFKVINHNPSNSIQMGIIKKDHNLSWSQQLSYLRNKHATYSDRLSFHCYGYHNYAGSRDDLISSTTIVSPAFISNTSSTTYDSKITSKFHNVIGKTGGTMRSGYSSLPNNSGGNSYWFYTNSYSNYNNYRGNSLQSGHGLKIKWYTTTLNVKLTNNSNIIEPVDSNYNTISNWTSSDLENVFSGMYIEDLNGSAISTSNGAFIGNINTNYMKMYQERGVSDLTNLNASSSTTTTVKITGYLYWTLSALKNNSGIYVDPVILGPPHLVLPRYQSDGTSSANYQTKEWAFYIGDTSGAPSNYFKYDILDSEPLNQSNNSKFEYSVTYSYGSIPNNGHGTLYLGANYLTTGNQGSALVTKTIDLSSTDYYKSSIIGRTGRIVLKYTSGTSYTGDLQFVNITINGVSYNVGSSSSTNSYNHTTWKRSPVASTGQSYPTTISDWNNYTDVSTTISNGYWNRDLNGTTSSNTGISIPSTYEYASIYFESSSPGYSNKTGYLASKPIDFTSNQITIKYYGYGATIGTLWAGISIMTSSGIYIGTNYLTTGNQGSSLVTKTIDLSSNDYVGSSIIGEKGYIILKYTSGTSYTGDLQFVNITINGVSYNVGSSLSTNSYNYTTWKKGPVASSGQTYTTSSYSSYSNVSTSYQNGYWIRDLNGTTSSGTGISIPSTYEYASIYFESSSPGYSNKTGYLASKQIDFTSNEIIIKYYGYGATIGTLWAGVEII